MRVYTALPAPAHRRSGRPLNAPSLGRTQSGLCCSALAPSSQSADRRGFWPSGPTVRGAFTCSGPPRSAPSASPRFLRCGRRRGSGVTPLSIRAPPSSTLSACGLTRRCSGPAVCAGLHCSPGFSPSSVWPAAERFFVRPHPKRLVLLRTCAVFPIRGPSRVLAFWPHGPRRLHLLGSAAFSSVRVSSVPSLRSSPGLGRHSAVHQGAAVFHALRVRPNQALQRTGSVCGFTLLSRFQPVVGLAGR